MTWTPRVSGAGCEGQAAVDPGGVSVYCRGPPSLGLGVDKRISPLDSAGQLQLWGQRLTADSCRTLGLPGGLWVGDRGHQRAPCAVSS